MFILAQTSLRLEIRIKQSNSFSTQFDQENNNFPGFVQSCIDCKPLRCPRCVESVRSSVPIIVQTSWDAYLDCCKQSVLLPTLRSKRVCRSVPINKPCQLHQDKHAPLALVSQCCFIKIKMLKCHPTNSRDNNNFPGRVLH